jgi:hypothetical protein
VSRWSADPLRIGLAPGEIALRQGSELRRLSSEAPGLSALLPLLDNALDDAAWSLRRIEIVLSQHFVRQILTPPPGKALSRSEESALAAASLREVYGEDADSWQVSVHSQPPHAGLLGAAIDRAPLAGLETLLARHGCRRYSVTPLASRAMGQLPARFDGWWVAVEPGRATLMGRHAGVWQHLAAQPVDDHWRDSLPDWLEHEAACAAVPIPQHVWIQPVGLGAVGSITHTGWQWQVLLHDAQARGAAALAGMTP